MVRASLNLIARVSESPIYYCEQYNQYYTYYNYESQSIEVPNKMRYGYHALKYAI